MYFLSTSIPRTLLHTRLSFAYSCEVAFPRLLCYIETQEKEVLHSDGISQAEKYLST